MKRLLFLFILAALPMAAKAEGKMILASCAEGQGCSCRLSEITLSEAIVVLGLEGGAGDVVVEAPDGSLSLSTEHPDDLNRRYGGSGNCSITLFDPPVPQDGLWSFTQRPLTTRGACLPQVKPMVDPMIAAMAAARRIVWGGSFHPDRFRLSEGGSPLVWHQTGPVDYASEVRATDSPMITARYRATLLSETTALATVDILLRGGPAALGMENCTFTAVLDARQSGD
ncbi:hypothetical protein [Gemmobacter serpentinus]|uniref:hypothetical protein n=1 Tax=Gemmobacter serpentinus TaxID=2652247 RepID=UPI00124EC9D8|nr:hypothetical protein [Gemmobacter serpentinus]